MVPPSLSSPWIVPLHTPKNHPFTFYPTPELGQQP